jgi:hypothetical protein
MCEFGISAPMKKRYFEWRFLVVTGSLEYAVGVGDRSIGSYVSFRISARRMPYSAAVSSTEAVTSTW